MGCQGVCNEVSPKVPQPLDNPLPKALPTKTSPPPQGCEPTDTVVKGNGSRAQGLADFRRSLAGSQPSCQRGNRTAGEITRDVIAHQPERAGHTKVDTALHVSEGAVTAAELALEMAGASTAAGAAGIAGAGLFVVSFLRGLRDAHVEGDRRVLRAAIAEGAARQLTQMCYPTRESASDHAEGLMRYRGLTRLGNREGNPLQAYKLGAQVVHEALKGCSPREIQAVKQQLMGLMPGYRKALQADDRPELFQRGLMEHLNADLAGRRVGH